MNIEELEKELISINKDAYNEEVTQLFKVNDEIYVVHDSKNIIIPSSLRCYAYVNLCGIYLFKCVIKP